MIRFQNVTKVYEDTGTEVFSHFDQEIEDGELILLTGKSGCGKTTFIRLLLKETPFTEGEIYVAGKKLSGLSAREIPVYRRQIGVVFQDFRLVPEMTVYENVQLAGLAVNGRKKDYQKRCGFLFSMLGITNLHKRYPKELSGGQMQKVCMARALMNHPSILLADEPTGNLDDEASKEIMRLFSLIREQGITVIVATHDKKNAEGIPYREIALGKTD